MNENLDNPVWSSLTDAHAALGRRSAHAARYLADVAPFIAVDSASTNANDELIEWVAPGESVLFVGPVPHMSASAWRIEPLESIAQMVSDSKPLSAEGAHIVELSAQHAADVLDLTARVYPHYFRPRTTAMGRYIGIYDGSKLAAMAGERMRFGRYVELSAICTDPAYVGRGFAQQLVNRLVADIRDADRIPFLHVSHRNVRAKALYEHLGFRVRVDIPLVAAHRHAAEKR
ncbi:MAG TPA: GNAT family N-acetyltransferase [Rudaea sp.]|jgi:ribosomal protein S18 acetylase RimI-like enzyme|nr:GNAT family N-acetyltransferase [Rudaea sp.]